MFPTDWSTNSALHMWTDASDKAIGAVYKNEWFLEVFDGDHTWLKKETIAWRELYALVKAVATWSHNMQGMRVVMHIGNESICYCVNINGTSKNKKLMCLIRSLYYYTAQNGFECRAFYLNSAENASADALSRIEFLRFLSTRGI